MANIFGSLHIGSSGTKSSQAKINITGHNVANANTDGYSRQRVDSETFINKGYANGSLGQGVETGNAKRAYDTILAENLRKETSQLAYYQSTEEDLKKVEIYFNELEMGSGLGDPLKEYFNAWKDLANTTPDSSAEANSKRYVLLSKAEVLTRKLNEGHKVMDDMAQESEREINEYVKQINMIAGDISEVNKSITGLESASREASDLRDKRDILLNELSEIVGINTKENDEGQLSVFIGSNILVDGNMTSKIFVKSDSNDSGRLNVYWGTTNNGPEIDITGQISGGSLKGELVMRNDTLKGYQNSLDSLSRELIIETNKIHSTGQGDMLFNYITSDNAATSSTSSLQQDIFGRGVEINKGTFTITLYDQDGNEAGDININIDPTADNLKTVAKKISEASVNSISIKATITSDHKINLSANGGTFSFKSDTSNFLTASGFNSFFTGDSAVNIGVSNFIKENPSFIATHDSMLAGDNNKSRAISGLSFNDLDGLGGVSINEFYSYFSGQIGADIQKVIAFRETKEHTVMQYRLKLDEIQGVSMDEEFINLMKFQKAFEANSRFITAVDEIIDRIINGMGVVGR